MLVCMYVEWVRVNLVCVQYEKDYNGKKNGKD